MVSFSQSGHLLAIACKAVAASVPLSSQGTVYSLRLFDTDVNEEVWAEPAAHHGVIYEVKWSKDDRYLLTCSGDGTCKVWDLLSLLFRTSPLQQQTLAGQSSKGATSVAVGRSMVTDSNSSLQGLLSGRNAMPSLVHTLSSARPVFVYTAVFQENGSSGTVRTGGLGYTHTSVGTSLDLAGSVEKLTDLENAAVPRIITGSSDGRLRVWDGSVMAGYISVRDKDSEGGGTPAEDFSPHDGQVNSIVIDERSK